MQNKSLDHKSLILRVFKQVDIEGNITFNFEEINEELTHESVSSLERLASLISGLMIDYIFLSDDERNAKISFLKPHNYIMLRRYDAPVLLKNLSKEEIDEFWQYFSKSYRKSV